MQALTELRRLARLNRDKAIAIAHDEYTATLKRIAEVEQDLLGHQISSHRSVSSCVEKVMPTDRPFTTTEVMAALEASNPRRRWYMRTVTNQLTRLRIAGVIRRIRRPKRNQNALYVRIGTPVPAEPFEDKTLADVVAAVLGDRRLNQTEICVAILDAGYKTSMKPRALRNAIAAMLRENRKRFSEQGGKWSGV
jgi:hypothetical protein